MTFRYKAQQAISHVLGGTTLQHRNILVAGMTLELYADIFKTGSRKIQCQEEFQAEECLKTVLHFSGQIICKAKVHRNIRSSSDSNTSISL